MVLNRNYLSENLYIVYTRSGENLTFQKKPGFKSPEQVKMMTLLSIHTPNYPFYDYRHSSISVSTRFNYR